MSDPVPCSIFLVFFFLVGSARVRSFRLLGGPNKSDLDYGSIIDLRVVSQWSVDVEVGGRWWWCSGWLWWRVQ